MLAPYFDGHPFFDQPVVKIMLFPCSVCIKNVSEVSVVFIRFNGLNSDEFEALESVLNESLGGFSLRRAHFRAIDPFQGDGLADPDIEPKVDLDFAVCRRR
jgi:hypothetical protein